MEQRRKIIIPTGADPQETLSTPHFDTEATLSARPVVPLSEPVALPPEDAYAVSPRVVEPVSNAATSSWKRSTLIFTILAAVSVGIASGLAIGLYQSRKKAPAPVSTQPPVSEPQQATNQPEPETAQSQPAEPPEAQARVPATLPDEEARTKPTDEPEPDDDDDKRVTRDNKRRDEARVPAPVVRERPTVDEPAVDDERDEGRARRDERRERRREERREERRRQREQNEDSPVNLPRNVERARQEINRIRDIFEGRQP